MGGSLTSKSPPIPHICSMSPWVEVSYDKYIPTVTELFLVGIYIYTYIYTVTTLEVSRFHKSHPSEQCMHPI